MKKVLVTIKNYIDDINGAMCMEWLGITAVVFVAAVAITLFVLQSADGLGGSVAASMDNAATQISN